MGQFKELRKCRLLPPPVLSQTSLLPLVLHLWKLVCVGFSVCFHFVYRLLWLHRVSEPGDRSYEFAAPARSALEFSGGEAFLYVCGSSGVR